MTVVPFELALSLDTKGHFFKSLNWMLGALTRMMPTLFGYQIMLVSQSRPAQGF